MADEPEDLAEVEASLEQAAEAGDPVPAVYARWFERDPQAAAVMDYVDPVTRGRMIAGVLELLLLDDVEEREAYLAFELANHRAYGARPGMYDSLLDAVRDVVREACGEDWDAARDRAWARRLGQLKRELEQG